MSADLRALESALARQANGCHGALERLRALATRKTEDEVHALAHQLQLSVVLVGILRRLAKGRTVRELHDAFGAPGDFGYETPIGAALADLYNHPGTEVAS